MLLKPRRGGVIDKNGGKIKGNRDEEIKNEGRGDLEGMECHFQDLYLSLFPIFFSCLIFFLLLSLS